MYTPFVPENLQGYNRCMKVALGVTGGIAAYKAAELVRLLQDRVSACKW